MHHSGSHIIRRALIVDGLFCVAAGLLVAVSAGWLEGELPDPGEGWIVAAGLVTAVWGVALVLASRSAPTRPVLTLVAAVNVVTVLAALAWLVLRGAEMSGIGIAVIGVLGISVLRFAIYQLWLLRQ